MCVRASSKTVCGLIASGCFSSCILVASSVIRASSCMHGRFPFSLALVFVLSIRYQFEVLRNGKNDDVKISKLTNTYTYRKMHQQNSRKKVRAHTHSERRLCFSHFFPHSPIVLLCLDSCLFLVCAPFRCR